MNIGVSERFRLLPSLAARYFMLGAYTAGSTGRLWLVFHAPTRVPLVYLAKAAIE